MNIEELRRIRNKSVQQQNQLMYLELKQEAESFRACPGEYPWLVAALAKNGHDLTGGLLISCSSVPEQGGNQWMGTWLTNEQKFFEFDIMVDNSTNSLLEIDGWEEFSPEISACCKGTGKSFGYIALELLAEYAKS